MDRTMQTIGLIGGMSWESTLVYYRELNRGVKRRLGGLHSAECVLYSVDFAPLEEMLRAHDLRGLGAKLGDAARKVQAGGADFILLCTNTMHMVWDDLEAAVDTPLLHIADATAMAAQKAGYTTLGLLGTAATMEREFYTGRLREKWGMEVLIPEPGDRAETHRVIFEELVLGTVKESSREMYKRMAEELMERGAEAVVLGCTEIGMLLDATVTDAPLLDTTLLHVEAALERALGGD